MKVAIITSSNYGTAAHHLPELLESNCCEVVLVIVSNNVITNKKKHYQKKIKKILKIGILGAINGIRMRKWYDEDVKKKIDIHNLEDTCKKNNIPYVRVDAVNSQITQDHIKSSKAELGLSLGNGYIAKKIYDSFPLGMLNIHHEELPAYQNASSIVWQIYNGSKNTGYTIHKIDAKIDTGDILYQEKIPISFEKSISETVTSTFINVLEHSSKGLVHVLKNFRKLYDNAQQQGKGSSYTTPTFCQYIKIYQQFKRMISNEKNN